MMKHYISNYSVVYWSYLLCHNSTVFAQNFHSTEMLFLHSIMAVVNAAEINLPDYIFVL